MAEITALELAEMSKPLTETQRMIFHQQYSSEKKDGGTAVILALFLYDRIWLGDTTLGIIKIITFGACGIWTVVDLFSAKGRADEYNRKKARDIVEGIQISARS